MATTLADIQARVLARLAADMSTPAYSKIDSDNLTVFANDLINKIVWHYINLFLQSKEDRYLAHLQGLMDNQNISLTEGTGVGTLTYEAALVTGVTLVISGTTVRKAKLFYDAAEFIKFDSSNFILTPGDKLAVAHAKLDSIYMRPINDGSKYQSAYIEYIKPHPALSGSQDTEFDAACDDMLVLLILSRCFDFLEEPELSNMALKEAGIGA